ncbi:MAG: GGDEF domain-containing protein [Gammaproteobacteria bacterium]|jgi:diguanylate cyclase (GGDEF)-like protein|nr:GGDEF domain-containing protein [Gammaproteobacteria bacterium]
MQSNILQFVVDITQQRDLDSMESSLVATLAELLPVIAVSILKTSRENNEIHTETVISLTIDEEKASPYCWNIESHTPVSCEHMLACTSSSTITTYRHENGYFRYLFPVSDESRTIACMVIDSYEDLSSQMNLIEGFGKIYQNYRILFNESERDKLTGLFNRRTFDNKLSRLFEIQQQHNSEKKLDRQDERRISETDDSARLIIVDIDNFKRVNDDYGHVFGDEVILTVSQIMKSCFRKTDLLFRVGGEEFVILLEPVTETVAVDLIERFRKAIADHDFSQIGTVTVSAGYARINENDYPPAVLDFADKALYYSKEHGRNCSHSYEALVQEGEITLSKRGGNVDIF